MKPTSPHPCPNCRCLWTPHNELGPGVGHINRDAPGWPAIEAVMAATDELGVLHHGKSRSKATT